ncbi:uncharacterized protein BDV14DRAFT_211789 [Aspergillus stella-maris]|uniref:uncharacterized protein n=1 Tax=Aspergillus stella-maris TaxID=1810926 RepID=UPI003CCDCDDB
MTEFQIPDELLTALKDKVVLITGSTSGIGLATTRLALSLGAKVIAGDINALPEPDHNELLASIPSPSQQDSDPKTEKKDPFLFIYTDVTSWPSIRNLFVTGIQHFGKIDHVFANAGIGPRVNFLEETFETGLDAGSETGTGTGTGPGDQEEDDLHQASRLAPPDLRVLDVNLLAVIYTVRLAVYFLHRFASAQPNPAPGDRTSSPSIVTTASASAFQDFCAADYTVAKHGVLGILRGLYTDLLQPSSYPFIRLNGIAPSWTATGIVAADILRPFGAIVQEPDVVARSVVYLFNDNSRHGELVYSWSGRYVEVNRCEGGLLEGIARLVPNVAMEGPVLERLKGRY